MLNNLRIGDMTNLAKEKIVPISVLVEVCHTCNENCIHCCVDQHSKRGMALKNYELLFDQFVNAGTFFVILTGGEPFTRLDFMKIVTAARKRRLSVTIFTNGTLLTQQIVNKLKSLHVEEVHISLYSADGQVHDGITRVEGSFKKSVNAIKMLISAGVNVRIKTPLMNVNYDGIEKLKALANQLGVSVQYANIITAKNNGDDSTCKLRLTDEQLRKALLDQDISQHSKKLLFSHSDMNCIPCDTVLNGGHIDPDGNVYVCNQWRIIGGNILDLPFGEIWKNSKEFLQLRKIRVADMKECKECKLLQYCTRCPGLAYLEDNNLYGCSQAAKKIAEIRKELGLFPTQAHIFSNKEGGVSNEKAVC